ncbi:hypothetical protein EJ05DRAFT_504274 [Pseudovirgaria hyperparasitica]|uniref:Heterokaryon incompatibility domain-containing protein n=1 Tax=Pseudovirgaria hyperparasitica TaxID=470096 RepID=A0A6A6VZC9_9PEZI|nr:uncharacterized protein EJ05DRAFT_504274 [Pseudovirgaria hyperparasitica]KAF2754171.1 hypothetical protein EJ05DRAFT_504274 [Pseudovirgaria hyperparasitica]
MERYKYSPLIAAENEIRFLTLCPSNVGQVYIKLWTASLPRKGKLPFHTDDPGSVLVENDTSTEPSGKFSSISITRNLFTVLPYLQLPDKPRNLWIDAVCINQEDIEERCQQVQLMAEIYSQASQVVAWLGPPSEGSDFGLPLLGRISSKFDVDWRSGHILWGTPREDDTRESIDYDIWLLDCTVAFPVMSREHRAMLEVYNRPYFERLWIRQEVTNPRKVMMTCGTKVLHAVDFHKATLLLYRKYLIANDKPSQDLCQRLLSVLQIFGDESIETRIENALTRTQAAKCFDPRDRVYAIFGLLSAKSFLQSTIIPDYTKAIAEVYREVIIAELSRDKRVTVLSHSEKKKTAFKHPSWVPDWSGERTRSSLSGHFADGEATATASLSDCGQVLRIEGLLVTTVKEVTKVQAVACENKEDRLRGILRQLLQSIDPSKPYPSGGTAKDACAYLFSGYKLLECMSELKRNDFLAGFDYMRDLLSSLAAQEDVDLKSRFGSYTMYISDILQACEGQALITTDSGLIGLGNTEAQPGDAIAIVLGCGRPLILRSQSNGNYEVIGSSSIHGLNWGEAVLGPFPRTRETGYESKYDPRVNWDELEIREDKGERIWYDDETEDGDIKLFEYPDAKYLKGKGVDIDTIKLV